MAQSSDKWLHHSGRVAHIFRNGGVFESEYPRLNEIHEKAFLEAFYHQLALYNNGNTDFVSLLKWFIPLLKKFLSKKTSMMHYEMIDTLEVKFKTIKNPHAYIPGMAITYYKLWDLLSDKYKWSAAWETYIGALENYRCVLKKKPKTFLQDAELVFENLWKQPPNLHHIPMALECYSVALKIYRSLAKKDPKFNGSLALILYKIGEIGYYQRDFDLPLPLNCYKESLKIYRNLAKEDHNFLSMVAEVLIKIADFGEGDYHEALKIYRNLAKDNLLYLSDVAEILVKLGSLAKDDYIIEECDDYLIEECRHYSKEESQRYFEEALSIYESINIQNHGIYTDRIEGLKRKLDEL